MTPTLHHPSYLPCIFAGVLSHARPWCKLWGGELLSVAAWLQVSQLLGFPERTVARAAHAAILSTSPHDHHKTVQYMYYIAPHMPTPKCYAINMTLWWLKKHAHWRRGAYSSWIIHPSLSPYGTTGSWNHNAPLLHDVQQHTRPQGHFATSPPVMKHNQLCVRVSRRLRLSPRIRSNM